jgi:nucleoside-diphosphate-sugar epimerase
VTGGTGFIGSHLVRRLVADGCRVHLLARPGSSPWRIADELPAVTVWPGDVTDAASVESCVAAVEPEVVFHLAGMTAGRTAAGPSLFDPSLDTNLSGSLHLIRAVTRHAPRLRLFVRLGGLSEYGHGPIPFAEGQREAPATTYAASQVAVTHLCQMLARSHGFPAVTLRPALVYGPAQGEDFFIPSVIRHCLGGMSFDMTSGEQTRDLVFVDDVVGALVAAAGRPDITGEVINVGSGREYVIRAVAEKIVGMTGADIALRIGARPDNPAEVRRLVCSTAKADQLLGWRAAVPLDVGLARTVAWYRAHPAGA